MTDLVLDAACYWIDPQIYIIEVVSKIAARKKRKILNFRFGILDFKFAGFVISQ
jgi:hypothetical protein